MIALLRRLVAAGAKLLSRSKVGDFFFAALAHEKYRQYRRVGRGGVSLDLVAPTPLLRWRAETFATKEPETLEWIDGFPSDAVFWDVGANVGLYSLYAAARHPGCRVFAFEPSAFNLILEGAAGILASSRLKTLLIEVTETFAAQRDAVARRMGEAGFRLKEKRQSDMIRTSDGFGDTFNQIWVRDR